MASEITEKFLSKRFGARVIIQKKKLSSRECSLNLFFISG